MTTELRAYAQRLVGAIPLSDHEELRVFVVFEEGHARTVNLRLFARTESGLRAAESVPSWRDMSPAELPMMGNLARRISIPLDQLDRFQQLLRDAQRLVFQLSAMGPYADD